MGQLKHWHWHTGRHWSLTTLLVSEPLCRSFVGADWQSSWAQSVNRTFINRWSYIRPVSQLFLSVWASFCVSFVQPWVKLLHLEDEMFFITNQPCLAATGGSSKLWRQSDSFLHVCQNRRTGPNKTMLAQKWVLPLCMCGDVVLTPGIKVASFKPEYTCIIVQMDIFAFVESLFCMMAQKTSSIFLNTITSVCPTAPMQNLCKNSEFKCLQNTEECEY